MKGSAGVSSGRAWSAPEHWARPPEGSAGVFSGRAWPGPARHSLSPFPKEGELVVAMCSRVMSLSDW